MDPCVEFPLCQLHLHTAAGTLAGWYADPLPAAVNGALQQAARGRMQAAYERGDTDFAANAQWIAARCLHAGKLVAEAHTLAADADGPEQQAFSQLLLGQLLLGMRLNGGMKRLDQGFRMAANLLPAADYFRVLARHEALRRLPLYDRARPLQALADLLREAGVIERLQGPQAGKRPHSRADGKDTLG